MQKQQIRSQVMALCSSLSDEERLKSEAATLKFIAPLIINANSVAIYHAHGIEFNLGLIIEYCQQQNKKLYQPVAYKHTRCMLFIPYDEKLKKIFYPPEYIAPCSIEWYNIDLIILPTVAVDHQGNRLGKGGGYYDATLGNMPRSHTKLCGVGYTCQIMDSSLPHESFDVKLDYFAAENGLINFDGK